MNDEEMENEEMKTIIIGLAKEINGMTEEEKLFSLKKIVQAELKGNRNRFWTTVTKKMLVNDDMADKILSNEAPFL